MKLADVINTIGATVSDESLASQASTRQPLGFSIDSRTIRAGDLFFAIAGEIHDGHRFVAEVMQKGALAAVVSRHWPDASPGTPHDSLILRVEDALAALQNLASAVARNWRGQLVAITGSAGKTTTKDLTAAVLSQIGSVMKTQGNFNNAYGLPLSILRMEADGAHADDFDYGVFEMGMNHAGELTDLARMAPPDVAVVTNVSAAHLEFFASVDAIADAKAELVRGLKPRGVAILNADDPRVTRMRRLRDDITVRTFGIDEAADVQARDLTSDGLSGISFTLVTPGGESRARLPLVGRHNLSNALAAAAVADHFQAPVAAITAAFAGVTAPKMRGEVLRLGGGYTVIDDSYNSNPRALVEMAKAITASSGFTRQIVVAGEMLELGEAGARLHYEAGQQIAELGVDYLIGVRGLAAEIVAGARQAGLPGERARFFVTPAEAGEFLAAEARAGDLILVKGSRGVRTEVVVEILKERDRGTEG